MKTLVYCMFAATLLCGSRVAAQAVTYTNFIRQVQFPSLVQWDASVAASGEQLSSLAIDPGGARFELWTVLSSPLTSYLLSSSYVGTYIPVATVAIRSEDGSSAIPRTRADRPFYVDYTVTGLRSGVTDPVPSKSVNFYHHMQSYGVEGNGITGLDRTQATLVSQAVVNSNNDIVNGIAVPYTQTYLINSLPGADRTKVRGEERFSFFSLADYQAPASQLASQFIQIWPVADATMTGITPNQLIRFSLPQLTLKLNDLYPNSTTYAHVYKGEVQLGATGIIVPGSALVINDSVPQSPPAMVINKYDTVFTTDGRYTMEVITVTPFGIERLRAFDNQTQYYVTFSIDRTIKTNGSFTTME